MELVRTVLTDSFLFLFGQTFGYLIRHYLEPYIQKRHFFTRLSSFPRMHIYTQHDPQWASKPLGTSQYTMGTDGCTVTDVAQALTIAGWNITPGELVDNLNLHSGFTDSHYLESSPGKGDGQPGLLYWGKVQELYPQFHLNEIGYTFQSGRWGKEIHWLLQWSDPLSNYTSDPWFGRESIPGGWTPLSFYKTANIIGAPVSVPVIFQIRTNNYVNARTSPEVMGSTKEITPNNISEVIKIGSVIECIDMVTARDGTKWYVTAENNLYIKADNATHL